MTPAERFAVLIDALGLTRNKFATNMGIASTQIYSVLNGRNLPSHKMYVSILETYPEVNIYYLLMEQGEPLNTGPGEVPEDELKKLKKRVAALERKWNEKK